MRLCAMIIAMNTRIRITTVGNFDLNVTAALNCRSWLPAFVVFRYGNHNCVVHRLFSSWYWCTVLHRLMVVDPYGFALELDPFLCLKNCSVVKDIQFALAFCQPHTSWLRYYYLTICYRKWEPKCFSTHTDSDSRWGCQSWFNILCCVNLI
jgi:hypothetical protein